MPIELPLPNHLKVARTIPFRTRSKMMTTVLLTRNKKRKRFAALHPKSVLSIGEIQAALSLGGKNTLWISLDQGVLSRLLKSVGTPMKRLGGAVLLHPLNLSTLPALQKCFNPIAFTTNGGILPDAEFAEARAAKNRADLFLAGTVDQASETLTLWRGNLKSLVVPFSAFPRSGDGIAPDFDAFSVTDYGHTVRLGDYEAAADAILYEFAPDYRRRKAKQRLETDRGLGPSIRRLRKQRGLRREDFAPVPAKTIARIEQGKVQTPQVKTRTLIGKILGVKPDEIETY